MDAMGKVKFESTDRHPFGKKTPKLNDLPNAEESPKPWEFNEMDAAKSNLQKHQQSKYVGVANIVAISLKFDVQNTCSA